MNLFEAALYDVAKLFFVPVLVLTIRRRWLLQELRSVERARAA